jgi:protein-S-isoprenylcysteine O-methyltransferase Ste14
MNNLNYSVSLIIFLIIILILRLLESYFLETKKAGGKKYGAWTSPVFLLIYVLIIVSSITEYIVHNKNINFLITAVGFTLLILKMLLKYWAALTLGKFWSHDVEINRNHELIKNGPYKYVRHPAYLSAILDTLGIPLLLNAYYTLIFAVIIRLSMIFVRIMIEEKALIEKFGEEYVAYKKETGALLPLLIKKK